MPIEPYQEDPATRQRRLMASSFLPYSPPPQGTSMWDLITALGATGLGSYMSQSGLPSDATAGQRAAAEIGPLAQGVGMLGGRSQNPAIRQGSQLAQLGAQTYVKTQSQQDDAKKQQEMIQKILQVLRGQNPSPSYEEPGI